MKNSHLAALIAALSIAGFFENVIAQTEPIPDPPRPARPVQTPLHRQAAAQSLAAFRAGDNETAIAKANECIARFGDAANRIQTILEDEKATLPKGAVSEADKKRIAPYQILHDVATCVLIKAWAEEKLGHKSEARKAYSETKKYTFARMADGESFSAPAEIASDRLSKLAR